MHGTIRILDLKNMDLDTKIVTISALVQKLWIKTYLRYEIGPQVLRITGT